MKIRFSYWDLSKKKTIFTPNSRRIRRAFEMVDSTENECKAYSKYLLSSLDSDFYENRFQDCDKLLEQINRIEIGDIESFTYEFDGFIHYVSRQSVTFEHAIFGVCPHWPLWSCPFSHYKIGVQTARDFFALPESLDTELIIELPESDMAKIALFPPKLFENEAAKEANHD